MVVTAADPALPWAVFPANVRTSYTGFMGIPVLLLVSVCVGCFIFRADGNCLLEVQELEKTYKSKRARGTGAFA